MALFHYFHQFESLSRGDFYFEDEMQIPLLWLFLIVASFTQVRGSLEKYPTHGRLLVWQCRLAHMWIKMPRRL
jgi:hypothetical protein